MLKNSRIGHECQSHKFRKCVGAIPKGARRARVCKCACVGVVEKAGSFQVSSTLTLRSCLCSIIFVILVEFLSVGFAVQLLHSQLS